MSYLKILIFIDNIMDYSEFTKLYTKKIIDELSSVDYKILSKNDDNYDKVIVKPIFTSKYDYDARYLFDYGKSSNITMNNIYLHILCNEYTNIYEMIEMIELYVGGSKIDMLDGYILRLLEEVYGEFIIIKEEHNIIHIKIPLLFNCAFKNKILLCKETMYSEMTVKIKDDIDIIDIYTEHSEQNYTDDFNGLHTNIYAKLDIFNDNEDFIHDVEKLWVPNSDMIVFILLDEKNNIVTDQVFDNVFIQDGSHTNIMNYTYDDLTNYNKIPGYYVVSIIKNTNILDNTLDSHSIHTNMSNMFLNFDGPIKYKIKTYCFNNKLLKLGNTIDYYPQNK